MGNAQTQQSDAKGVGQRRSSIAWTTRRREYPTMMVFNSKLSIVDWLDLLNLHQYENNFNMYNRVDDILDLDDTELKLKGVRNPRHRARMLSSLVGVQAKRRQSMNIGESVLSRALSDRKHSCPPIYLTEQVALSRANVASSRSSSERSSLARLDGDLQRLTNSTSFYEEVNPSESDSPTPTPSIESNNAKPEAQFEKMDNGSTPNECPQPASLDSITPASEQQEAFALKKALEWELGLDSKDLRSHAWYHGPLPRQRAEEIVQRDGDFLVRDCASQPDNYVLTCRTSATVLHFVINKVLLQPETVYERIQYQFEEDAFDTVPDLITFYVGSGKPISAASRARIQHPCNRTYPLSFYGHKIVGNQLHTQMLAGVRGASPLNSPLTHNGTFRFGTCNMQQSKHGIQSPLSSPPRTKRDTLPRLPSKKQRSQSLIPIQGAPHVKSIDVWSSVDTVPQDNGPEGVSLNGHGRRLSNFERSSLIAGSPSDLQLRAHLEHLTHTKIHGNGFQTIARCSMGDVVDHFKFTTHSLPRPSTNAFRYNPSRISSLARDFSLDSANFHTSLEGKQILELPELPLSPPPKPMRIPTLPRKEKDIVLEQQYAMHRMGAGYQASGSDSGNGSGDSFPGDIGEYSQHRGVIIKNPRFISNSTSATLKSLAEFNAAAAEQQLFTLKISEFKLASKFDVENFSTLLLPSVENKPLDGDALNTFKIMLLENGPRVVSEHLTRIDIRLLIEQPSEEDRNDIFNYCGLEMLTLPHGKVFRTDVIERAQCIKLMVAVTILTCQTDLDRAELISKWIEVAVETKTALGNLFGFCAIMLGLCMQQIQKLESAWHLLRQKYTDNAFTFEAKLRPTLNSMNECNNPQAPNTTIPHVLVYAILMDRSVIDIINVANPVEKSSLYKACVLAWENKADDFGMTIHHAHLEASRDFLRNLQLFRKNARILLEESNSRMDELLNDAFRTEFHVKFLWGSIGAMASAEDRHSKLEKVLALMADRFSNANNNAT